MFAEILYVLCAGSLSNWCWTWRRVVTIC